MIFILIEHNYVSRRNERAPSTHVTHTPVETTRTYTRHDGQIVPTVADMPWGVELSRTAECRSSD